MSQRDSFLDSLWKGRVIMDSLSQNRNNLHTIQEIEAFPEGTRAELIDGEIYYMSAPSRLHQKILGRLFNMIQNHIDRSQGSCEVYAAPFAVYLSPGDDGQYYEPDIAVICDPGKLIDKGCAGAPDWIIEISSPSTERRDLGVKLFKYRSAGVREYWVVIPEKKIVTVFLFGQAPEGAIYSFDNDIPVHIYEGFSINLAGI